MQTYFTKKGYILSYARLVCVSLCRNKITAQKNTHFVNYIKPRVFLPTRAFLKASAFNICEAPQRGEAIFLRSGTALSETFFNFTFDKGRLKSLVSWTLENYGEYKTVELLEALKKTGFEYATKAGISLGIEDLKIPPKKTSLLLEAEQQILKTVHQYQRGDITAVERFKRLIDTWHRTSEQLKQEVISYFEETDILNPVYMMAFSGARGNISQVRQLVGMRGLMSDPKGQIIDYPIRSNFREGLTLTEYIISSYGSRKGIVDTALRTANAGYLTRRLVDVAQHVIISHYDCGTQKGIFLTEMKEGNKTILSLQNRLIGRVLARDVYKKEGFANNKGEGSSSIKIKSHKIASRNQEVSSTLAVQLALFSRVFVRSSLTCETNKVICQLCYGWSLAQGKLVSVGETVGVIAAQSIGEPGTQLTMRTFHTGGVFAGDVSDEIRAPFDGFVEYSHSIPGTLIRTLDGKIAFLTKSDGNLILKKKGFANNLGEGYLENSKNIKDIKKYKIPAYTILYIRNGANVFKKQVVAQITNVSTQPNMLDTAEYTIKSELEGLFYAKNLDLQKKIIGPKPKLSGSAQYKNIFNVEPKAMQIILKSRDWNFAWVLSGKRYELPFFAPLFPNVGDYVTTKTIMTQNNWMPSNVNYQIKAMFSPPNILLAGYPINTNFYRSLCANGAPPPPAPLFIFGAGGGNVRNKNKHEPSKKQADFGWSHASVQQVKKEIFGVNMKKIIYNQLGYFFIGFFEGLSLIFVNSLYNKNKRPQKNLNIKKSLLFGTLINKNASQIKAKVKGCRIIKTVLSLRDQKIQNIYLTSAPFIQNNNSSLFFKPYKNLDHLLEWRTFLKASKFTLSGFFEKNQFIVSQKSYSPAMAQAFYIQTSNFKELRQFKAPFIKASNFIFDTGGHTNKGSEFLKCLVVLNYKTNALNLNLKFNKALFSKTINQLCKVRVRACQFVPPPIKMPAQKNTHNYKGPQKITKGGFIGAKKAVSYKHNNRFFVMPLRSNGNQKYFDVILPSPQSGDLCSIGNLTSKKPYNIYFAFFKLANQKLTINGFAEVFKGGQHKKTRTHQEILDTKGEAAQKNTIIKQKHNIKGNLNSKHILKHFKVNYIVASPLFLECPEAFVDPYQNKNTHPQSYKHKKTRTQMSFFKDGYEPKDISILSDLAQNKSVSKLAKNQKIVLKNEGKIIGKTGMLEAAPQYDKYNVGLALNNNLCGFNINTKSIKKIFLKNHHYLSMLLYFTKKSAQISNKRQNPLYYLLLKGESLKLANKISFGCGCLSHGSTKASSIRHPFKKGPDASPSGHLLSGNKKINTTIKKTQLYNNTTAYAFYNRFFSQKVKKWLLKFKLILTDFDSNIISINSKASVTMCVSLFAGGTRISKDCYEPIFVGALFKATHPQSKFEGAEIKDFIYKTESNLNGGSGYTFTNAGDFLCDDIAFDKNIVYAKYIVGINKGSCSGVAVGPHSNSTKEKPTNHKQFYVLINKFSQQSGLPFKCVNLFRHARTHTSLFKNWVTNQKTRFAVNRDFSSVKTDIRPISKYICFQKVNSYKNNRLDSQKNANYKGPSGQATNKSSVFLAFGRSPFFKGANKKNYLQIKYLQAKFFKKSKPLKFLNKQNKTLNLLAASKKHEPSLKNAKPLSLKIKKGDTPTKSASLNMTIPPHPRRGVEKGVYLVTDFTHIKKFETPRSGYKVAKLLLTNTQKNVGIWRCGVASMREAQTSNATKAKLEHLKSFMLSPDGKEVQALQVLSGPTFGGGRIISETERFFFSKNLLTRTPPVFLDYKFKVPCYDFMKIVALNIGSSKKQNSPINPLLKEPSILKLKEPCLKIFLSYQVRTPLFLPRTLQYLKNISFSLATTQSKRAIGSKKRTFFANLTTKQTNILVGNTNYTSPFEGEYLYTKPYKRYLWASLKNEDTQKDLKTGFPSSKKLDALSNINKAYNTLDEQVRAAMFNTPFFIKGGEGPYLEKNKPENLQKESPEPKKNPPAIITSNWSRFNLILTKKDLISFLFCNVVSPIQKVRPSPLILANPSNIKTTKSLKGPDGPEKKHLPLKIALKIRGLRQSITINNAFLQTLYRCHYGVTATPHTNVNSPQNTPEGELSITNLAEGDAKGELTGVTLLNPKIKKPNIIYSTCFLFTNTNSSLIKLPALNKEIHFNKINNLKNICKNSEIGTPPKINFGDAGVITQIQLNCTTEHLCGSWSESIVLKWTKLKQKDLFLKNRVGTFFFKGSQPVIGQNQAFIISQSLTNFKAEYTKAFCFNRVYWRAKQLQNPLEMNPDSHKIKYLTYKKYQTLVLKLFYLEVGFKKGAAILNKKVPAIMVAEKRLYRYGVTTTKIKNGDTLLFNRYKNYSQTAQKNLNKNINDLSFYSKPVVKKSGQLIHMNKRLITLRLGQPIVVSPRSIIHAYHGDFVSFKTPVITLTYQQLKTGDIVQGIPKIEQLFEARTTKRGRLFRDNLTNLLTGLFLKYFVKSAYLLKKENQKLSSLASLNYNKTQNSTLLLAIALKWAVKQSFYKIQQIIVDGILRVYRSQGVSISDKHVEIIVKQMTSKVRIINSTKFNASLFTQDLFSLNTLNPASKTETNLTVQRNFHKQINNLLVGTLIENNLEGPAGLFPGEIVDLDFVENINQFLLKTGKQQLQFLDNMPQSGKHQLNKSKNSLQTEFLSSTTNALKNTIEPLKYEPIVLGITRASLEVDSFLSAASFQQTTRVLSQAALYKKKDFLKGLKENILIGNLIPAGTGYLSSIEFCSVKQSPSF